MTVSEARAALPQILERVRRGEEVTLTRRGEPVAVVVRPDALRPRRAEAALSQAQRVRELLLAAGSQELGDPVLSVDQAGALLDDVRASRAVR